MSRYTKAHYEQLARIVCAASYNAARNQYAAEQTTERDAADFAIRTAFAARLAEAFAQDNPRFNADLWFEACGVSRGVRE